MPVMETVKKAWINAHLFVVTLVVNTLGALGVINGLSQKEVSDKFVTLITPSPSTFRIWSVIYSMLILSVVVMIVKRDSQYYKNAIDQISTLFQISCMLNIAWIIAFSYVQIELSVILVYGFAVTLLLLCHNLLKVDDGKHWLLPVSFGIYAGWLLIAAIVNTAAMLVKLKWNGFGIAEEIWAIISLIAAIALVVVLLSRIKNAALPLPVAWAYSGIYQSLIAPEGFNGQYGLLQHIVLGGMTVLIALSAIRFYRNHL